jgi:hypothetical protein
MTSCGFAMMVDAAERDDDIADSLVKRSDLPRGALADLVARATPRRQARLLKLARPEIQDAIRTAIDCGAARASAKPPATIDYAEARATVMALNNSGQLNDSSVNRFAIRRETRNVVAALAQLASVPIETVVTLMEVADINGLVIACRASRLNWNTTAAIVSTRKAGLTVAPDELERAREMFEALPLSNAQRAIRFGSLSELTAKLSRKM